MDFRRPSPRSARWCRARRHIAQRPTSARHGRPAPVAGLPADVVAALYLYTIESAFYRQLNAALRDPDRGRSPRTCRTCGCSSRPSRGSRPAGAAVARGVAGPARAVPARKDGHLVGGVLVHVEAQRGPGLPRPPRQADPVRGDAGAGRRHPPLLRVHRRGGVHPRPGTRLTVTDVQAERGGLCTVRLTELAEQRLVT